MRSETYRFDHAEHLESGKRTRRVEVVTARAVHTGYQLSHVCGEVVFGRHLRCRTDCRIAVTQNRLLAIRTHYHVSCH